LTGPPTVVLIAYLLCFSRPHDNEPELARTIVASVKLCIAFGERARENVRRIGSGFGSERAAELPSAHAVAEEGERLEQDAKGELMYRCNRPWSDGTTGIKPSLLELLGKLAALVPLPPAHLVRYGGC
jgi:hypothetical protein